jgi:uncharacterized delta-60 repeat protein
MPHRSPTRRALAGAFATAATIAATAAPAFGAAGDLDASFGTGGISLAAHPPSQLKSVLAQPDGKVVLTGTDDSGQDFWAQRLTSVGTPDPTFGKTGVVTTDLLDQTEDEVRASALQPDGKLVLVGWSSQANTASMSLVRYLDDGTPDPAFGPGGVEGDGKVLLPNLVGIQAAAIVFQAEGRIAVVGDVGTGGLITIYRVDAHGKPDEQQPKPVDLNPGGAFAYDAAAAADGRILVLAQVDGAAMVARLTAAGALDTTFGEGGKVTLPEIDQPSALEVLPDGRLLVSGVAGTGAQAKTAVMRLDAKGTIDRGFGEGGLAIADFPGDEWSPRLMVQRDGKILVSVALATQYEFAAARFTVAGKLDATYRAGGLFTFPVLSLSAVFGAAVTAHDELILAGPAYKVFPVGQLATVRLQADPPPVPAGGGGTPSGPGGGEAPADTQPPALTRVRVLRKAPGARLRIAFSVSEPARVRVTVRRRHGRARRVTIEARAGVNRVRVSRRLRAGRYTVAAKAIDAAGNVSGVRRVHFTAT